MSLVRSKSPEQAADFGIPASSDEVGSAEGAGNAAALAAFGLGGDADPAGSGSSQIPATHSAAVARHAANKARLSSMIAQGLATEVDPESSVPTPAILWRNTCQFIDTGAVGVKPLSPVHDNPRDGHPGLVGYFGDAGDDYVDAADLSDPASDGGLFYATPGVRGRNATVVIYLMDPSISSDDDIREFLIHEIQHSMGDQPGGPPGVPRDVHGDDTTADSASYAMYEEEFRAFWVADAPGDPTAAAPSFSVRTELPDGTLAERSTQFQNERQALIFRDDLMYGDTGRTRWWNAATHQGYRSYGFAPHFYAADDTFFRWVNAHDWPQSANPVNSVRVAALEAALVAHAPSTEILAAAHALDAVDRGFLASSGVTTAPFWKLVADQGDPALESQIREIVYAAGP